MDLLGRIEDFIHLAGSLGLILAGVFLLALILITAMGKRKILLALYLFLLMFSGFVIESVSAGTTLLRWVVMFLIAATGLTGMRSPGAPCLLLGIYGLVGLITAPLAPDTFWAIQRSGLLVVISLPMAAAIAQRLATLDDIYKVLKTFILAGGLYVLLGMATLPSLAGGERFAGATSSAPLFVLTGGLLLPIALWGAMQSGIRQWRIYCIVIAVVTGMLCIISGQRTGTLAGFIGCLPLLARFGMRKLLIGLVLLAVGIGLIYLVFSFMPQQAEFVLRRFTTADTTGRVERWHRALDLCMQNPFLGQGVGADQTHHFGFHNAYLVTWLEMGLVGLILYAGALVWMATRSLRLILGRGDRETKDVARLLLGLTLASMAAAFFESKLVSPSNIAIFTAVMTSVMLVRLKELADQGPLAWDPYDEYGPHEDYGTDYGEDLDSPPSTA